MKRARRESTYFLDLGDPTGRAVAIRETGWRVVDRPGVHFRRPEGLLPLPVPAREGSVDLLRQYVNLTDAGFSADDRLADGGASAGRAVSGFGLERRAGVGEEHAGEDSAMLIDPQTCPSLAIPDSTHDLMATAVNGWLVLYENITTLAGLALRLRLPARVWRGLREPHAVHERRAERHLRSASGDAGRYR